MIELIQLSSSTEIRRCLPAVEEMTIWDCHIQIGLEKRDGNKSEFCGSDGRPEDTAVRRRLIPGLLKLEFSRQQPATHATLLAVCFVIRAENEEELAGFWVQIGLSSSKGTFGFTASVVISSCWLEE